MQNCEKTQNPTIYFESHCYAALAAREIKKVIAIMTDTEDIP